MGVSLTDLADAFCHLWGHTWRDGQPCEICRAPAPTVPSFRVQGDSVEVVALPGRMSLGGAYQARRDLDSAISSLRSELVRRGAVPRRGRR